MNTSIKQKEKYWNRFVKSCESQWKGGGKRYALSDNKEFTDLITEALDGGSKHDKANWIMGNIIKYTGEIVNAKRAGGQPQEVNYFKIAVYSFLAWLKQMDAGFLDKDPGEEFTNKPFYVCPLCGYEPKPGEIIDAKEDKDRRYIWQCPKCKKWSRKDDWEK